MKHLKQRLALVLSLMMVLSIFTAPATASADTKKTTKPQELTLNLGPDPLNLDPAFYGGALTSGCEGGHILNNTFEGLMREVNRKLVPASAEKYVVSTDGLTYTFTLRDSKWSDGKAVTAKDFEYAWKRVLDPKAPMDYSFLMYCIKGAQDYTDGKGSADNVGVKALDEKTLQVTLTSPTSYFPTLTALHNFMPVRQDMVEKNPANWSKTAETAVGNGPFKISSYTPGKKIVLIKNENYWNAKVVILKKITASITEDEAAAVAAYKKNKLDIVDITNHQDIPALKNITTLKLLPEHMSYYFTFNTQKAPMKDVRVRKALSMAIDRNFLIKNATKPGLFPAGGLVPIGFRDSQNKEFRGVATEYGLVNNPDTIQAAKKLLAEAGFADGKGFPSIEITFSATAPEHENIAKAIQSMWKANLGIDATLKKMDSKEFYGILGKGDFTIARQGWGADFPDPISFLDRWTSGNADSNGTFWKSEKYDQLIATSLKTTGTEKDAALYAAEKMVIDEMIVMPIYYLSDPVLVQNHVHGWEKTVLSYWWFGNTSISKK